MFLLLLSCGPYGRARATSRDRVRFGQLSGRCVLLMARRVTQYSAGLVGGPGTLLRDCHARIHWDETTPWTTLSHGVRCSDG